MHKVLNVLTESFKMEWKIKPELKPETVEKG